MLTVKCLLDIDDSLDLFAEHAIGGIIGLLACAFFGDKDIVALDGVSTIEGGWIDHNW
jgi:Amt family ammonium transporter